MTTARHSSGPPPAHRRRARADRRLVARGELPVGRPDLPARQPAAARAAAPRARQAEAARPLGDHPGAELPLRAHEPRDPRARPRRDLRHRPGPRRPGTRRQRLSRRHLHRGLSAHRPRRGGPARGCFASSRSPAGSPATSRRRRPGRSTRAASSATRWCTPTARRSTTRTCWRCASSATARPRPARWRPAGTRTSSSTRRATAPCCPVLHLNGYKIANPTVLARIPHDELARADRGLRLRAALRRGRPIPTRCTS